MKSPKALADAVIWVQKAILDFGLAGVSVQKVVLALKAVLSNPNQGARTAAISCLGTVQSFSKSGKESLLLFKAASQTLPADIRNLLQDSSSQILQLLDAEFENVTKRTVVQPLKAPVVRIFVFAKETLC